MFKFYFVLNKYISTFLENIKTFHYLFSEQTTEIRPTIGKFLVIFIKTYIYFKIVIIKTILRIGIVYVL